MNNLYKDKTKGNSTFSEELKPKTKLVSLKKSATKITLGGDGPIIEINPFPSGKYG